MIDVTALVLTYNERENIGRTLAALDRVPHVLIVDSFSTDGTAEIVKGARPEATILQRKFDTHAGQWNYGVEYVNSEWVLSLDADYIVTKGLSDEIRGLEPPMDISGYSARFHYCVWGERLRGSLYPPRTVLFRRDRGRYVDDGHTQIWQSNGRVLPLRGYIDHDDRKPLSRWVTSQVKYSALEARHLLDRPPEQLQDKLRRGIFFAPAVVFLYLLIARGLIFDGWRGWFYVGQRTIAELLLSLQLMVEKYRLEGKWEGESAK